MISGGPELQSTQPLSLLTENVSLDYVRQIAVTGHLYAIVDACDQPAVPVKAEELGKDLAISLYRGTPDEDYWAIAPYLLRVDTDVFDWIVKKLWQEPWGIFVVSEADMQTLWKHFQNLLTVELPEGEQLYFRYYDPRVLPNFIQTCIPAEINDLLGPVACYMTGTEPLQTLLKLTANKQIDKKTIRYRG